MRGKLIAIAASLALALSACSTTKVFMSHPAMVKTEIDSHAKVYFLREMPQRTRGIADDDLRIEVGEQPLLFLARGEYSLVRFKPGRYDVVVHSKTMLTTNPAPVEVWRSRPFEFAAGQSYYILTRSYQEEWRGFYFVPESIGEGEAKSLSRHMAAAGELTEAQPLYVPPPDIEPEPFDPVADALSK